MSQRLHIGETQETFYDCVLVTPEGAHEKLIREWLAYSNGVFLYPLKIRIVDMALWRQVEPIVAEVLRSVGKAYPDSVWEFYCGEREIQHPTAEELKAWIEEMKK